MGMLRRVRPLTGFPPSLQASTLGITFVALTCFLLSRWVVWQVKLCILTILWVAIWLPKPLFAAVQLFFNAKVVVFRFPSAGVQFPVDGKPLLALTIDDGPALEFDRRPADQCSTAEIFQSLTKFGVKATWFVIGSHVCEDREELLQDLVRAGHELGNHGMYDRPACLLGRKEFMEDVECAQGVIHKCGGGQRGWFRPSHALFTPWQLSWLRENGYCLAIGNVYPHDAVDLPPLQCSSPTLIAWHLKRKAGAGDIIIIHDRPWTPAVLELALPVLSERFRICTLSELADASEEHAAMSAGVDMPTLLNSKSGRETEPNAFMPLAMASELSEGLLDVGLP